MLVGVGLGPGDPELLTLRALRLIREADRIFVPGEVANEIITPYRNDAVILSFPMTDDEAYIAECMEQNADVIAPAAKNGLAVFGILGDPNFFGTYARLIEVLKNRHPEIESVTVPGISAVTAFASVAHLSVNGGFEVTDGSPLAAKILLKVTRPRETAANLRKEGYDDFVLVERMYMKGERVVQGDDLPEKSPYFSVMFARRKT